MTAQHRAPITMWGRYFPHRVSVRSTIRPTMGSLMASQTDSSIVQTPTTPMFSPATSVIKFMWNCMRNWLGRVPANPPSP